MQPAGNDLLLLQFSGSMYQSFGRTISVCERRSGHHNGYQQLPGHSSDDSIESGLSSVEPAAQSMRGPSSKQVFTAVGCVGLGVGAIAGGAAVTTLAVGMVGAAKVGSAVVLGSATVSSGIQTMLYPWTESNHSVQGFFRNAGIGALTGAVTSGCSLAGSFAANSISAMTGFFVVQGLNALGGGVAKVSTTRLMEHSSDTQYKTEFLNGAVCGVVGNAAAQLGSFACHGVMRGAAAHQRVFTDGLAGGVGGSLAGAGTVMVENMFNDDKKLTDGLLEETLVGCAIGAGISVANSAIAEDFKGKK